MNDLCTIRRLIYNSLIYNIHREIRKHVRLLALDDIYALVLSFGVINDQ